jgi:hypothetical protein
MDVNAWIALGALAVAFGGLLLGINSARRTATAELHRRIDELTTSLANFQRHVPEHYATIAYLKDVEGRIMGSVKESEARLATDILQAEGRLGSWFTRLEGKIDRLPTGAGE